MRLLSIFALSVVSLSTVPALSAPISVDAFGNPWEVYHFKERQGSSSIHRSPRGPRTFQAFGVVNVVPNGKGRDDTIPDDPATPVDEAIVSEFETTGIARQNGTEVELVFQSTPFDPNEAGGGVGDRPDLAGSWEITLTNGTDTLVVNTPELGSVDIPERVSNVVLSQRRSITSPTLTWRNNETEADAIAISIYDLNRRNAATGRADRIFLEFLDPRTADYRIPEGVLDEGGLYSARISTRINRSFEDGTAGFNPSGSSQEGAALARGDTFFDFPTVDLRVEEVLLPELSFGEDRSVVFNFDNPVIAREVRYYDPFVAVGYDYQIGDGNPFFSSFILPEIGDDLFELHLWDGADYVFDQEVAAGIEYFLADMTDRFRILGIETGAALDPTDPSAFVTGLSFASDGQFTGTMTPISVFVAPVPVPASVWGLLAGLAGLSFARRRVVCAAKSAGE